MLQVFERSTHVSAWETEDELVVTATCAESCARVQACGPLDVRVSFAGPDRVMSAITVTRGTMDPMQPGWASCLVGRTIAPEQLRHMVVDVEEQDAVRLVSDAVEVALGWPSASDAEPEDTDPRDDWLAVKLKW